MKNLKNISVVRNPKTRTAVVTRTSKETLEQCMLIFNKWSKRPEINTDWITDLGFKSYKEVRPYHFHFIPNVFDKDINDLRLKYIHEYERQGYKVINKQR